MKEFLIKIIKFSIIIIISFGVIYYAVDRIINEKSADNTIFIWGDSQAYQGLNLELMSELTGEKIYSAAKHGAGVYDFLVFTEKIPKGSNVIVAISKPVQLRRKSKDRNRSGISLWALENLYNNNYNDSEIYDILEKNIALPILYTSRTNLYPYADSIVLEEPISLFESIYADKPTYLDDKQALYVKGIENLIKKECQISFVEFPYHRILYNIEKNSVVKKYTENLKIEIDFLFPDLIFDSLYIDNSKTLMHDLTHFNVLGANECTNILISRMNNTNNPTIYIINAGVCN